MNITINDLPMGGDTAFKISAPIDGLETPPIRNSTMNYSGKDGGLVTGQYYSPRLITITGFIISSTAQTHEQARRQLQEALPIREDLDFIVNTFADLEYISSVRLLDFKMSIIDPVGSQFKIDLFASDPNLYTGDIQSALVSLEEGGGFLLPTVVFPIIFDPGTAPTIVTNSGAVDVLPIITIEGTATNPRITKTETGEYVEVQVTMGASDELIIDMANRTITLNGGSIISFRESGSSWWDLDVGGNPISYETDDSNDTGTCTVSWRNAVVSV